jgi:hypothetical protein
LLACLCATMRNIDEYLKATRIDWFHGYEGEAKIDFYKKCAIKWRSWCSFSIKWYHNACAPYLITHFVPFVISLICTLPCSISPSQFMPLAISLGQKWWPNTICHRIICE